MKKVNVKLMKSVGAMVAAVAILAFVPLSASAHCDTMDGPTVADGLKAMEDNNINYAIKWVQPEFEDDITDAFNLSMKVKVLSPEAKEISEKYFLGELVRIHRAGEGAPFTGVKPSGTPIDEKVLAADESIALGNLSPLEGMIEEEKVPELEERFDKVMGLKDFNVDDVEAGREYIEAYVSFFKFAEGEEEHHGEAGGHTEAAAEAGANSHTEVVAEAGANGHTEVAATGEVEDHQAVETASETEAMPKTEETSGTWIPWTLAGLFFVTTVISHVKLKHNHK